VLLREETSFHDVHDAGQLTSRLTSDCYAISRTIATNVNVALRNGLQVIGELSSGHTDSTPAGSLTRPGHPTDALCRRSRGHPTVW